MTSYESGGDINCRYEKYNGTMQRSNVLKDSCWLGMDGWMDAGEEIQ